MRHYHKFNCDPAPCSLELMSRGANTVGGRVFDGTQEKYYKLTRGNLIKISNLYREMASDSADIKIILVCDFEKTDLNFVNQSNVICINTTTKSVLSQLIISSTKLVLENVISNTT